MRFTRAALCASVMAFAVSFLAAPAQAGTDNYVALGDSYAAGTGAGDYSGGSCFRSANAYPVLWRNANGPSSFKFVACGGATTDDVLGSQVGALSAATTLVSISIGGNDAGFGDVMLTCSTGSDAECVAAVDKAKAYMRDTLPGKLDATYAAIRAKAPNARVVVLGYPYIFNASPCWWIGDVKKKAVNDGADLLSEVTEGRAVAAGFTYEDVRDNFAGHEVCTSTPWIHAVVWNGFESFHPTKTGQARGYYPAFRGAA